MRRPDDLRQPYTVDSSALQGALRSIQPELGERIRHQLNAIAELAGIMPPPVPLQGLGPTFDAYSLRVDTFTILYSVDPARRQIILRDVNPPETPRN